MAKGRLKKKFRKKDIDKLAEHGAEKVQTTLEQIDGEEAYDEATKTAIEEIKKHPELAMKILATINENVSSKVVVNTVIKLPQEEEFSEKTAVKAAEQLDLEDEHKVTIIVESNLEYENKMQIANQLEDKEIRDKIQKELKSKEEERSLNKLDEIYMMCNQAVNEVTLQNEIEKVMKNLPFETEAIHQKINRIIARKIAFNYATYGTNIVSKQRYLMTAKKMCEINMVQLAKEEYEKIISENDSSKENKIKAFNEEELKYNILKEMEVTVLEEEIDEEESFNELKTMLKTLMYDERKELLIKFKEEIQNKNIRKTYQGMRKLGLVQILSELEQNKRERVLETLKDVIEKRIKAHTKLKVAKITPKIKESKFSVESQIDESR